MTKQNTLSVKWWFGLPGNDSSIDNSDPTDPKITLSYKQLRLDGLGWTDLSGDEFELGDLWLIAILHRALWVSERHKKDYENAINDTTPNFEGIYMSVRGEQSPVFAPVAETINGIPCKTYNFAFKVSIPDKLDEPHPFSLDIDRLIP